MKARILSHAGSQDGLRFGDVKFSSNHVRQYLHDRLTGQLKLYALNHTVTLDEREDDDAGRLKAARIALAEMESRPLASSERHPLSDDGLRYMLNGKQRRKGRR